MLRRVRPGPHRLVGLGHRPFTAATGVRIPLGMPVNPSYVFIAGVYFYKIAIIQSDQPLIFDPVVMLVQDADLSICSGNGVNRELLI